jgi:hypothetical protein
MGSSTMIGGGGASWATAGCMTQPAAIRRVVRAIKSGEPRQLISELVVNFIPFIVISPDLCRCHAHSMGETRYQAKRQELLENRITIGWEGVEPLKQQARWIALLEIRTNVRFLEI